ncbi:MAG: hypothetical protein ACOYM2_10550 [Rectinemataceae bacterium]
MSSPHKQEKRRQRSKRVAKARRRITQVPAGSILGKADAEADFSFSVEYRYSEEAIRAAVAAGIDDLGVWDCWEFPDSIETQGDGNKRYRKQFQDRGGGCLELLIDVEMSPPLIVSLSLEQD